MKNLIVLLIMVSLVGCKKEEVLIPDFMDSVPDARFAGTWYQSNNKNDFYTFSTINNLISRTYYISAGSLMDYQMYWRKSKDGSGFESKLTNVSNENWNKFEIEFINETTIKIENTTYTK